tara:strand:+ start:649 stop:1164 length:516 start_codon:yes stop_codon:yes gene_type:complete
MSKPDRRKKFKELCFGKENREGNREGGRLEKAKKSIRAIGRLSEKSNYIYTDKDVAQIKHTLEAEVRATMILFLKRSGSVEERYKRLLDFDYEVIRSLETRDPELYDYILEKQAQGSSALVEYINERKKIEETFDVPGFLSETNESSGNKDLHAEVLEKLDQIQEVILKIK